MSIARRAVLAGMLLLVSRRADGQWGVWPGDSLLAAGRLAAAESAYYAAARSQPHNPVARAALGKFLAARGAARVGAVLLEEARRFGGDSTALARALVPLYVRVHDYRALSALRPNVLTPAERRRAEWLSAHPPRAELPDSVALVTYRPVGDGTGFGTVLLRLGSAELPAVIDPRISGLIVPPAVREDLRAFGSDIRGAVVVIPTFRLGRVSFTNMPARIGEPGKPIRVGFDVLAPHAPGFDPARGVLTLRKPARRSVPPAGERVPVLYDTNGARVLLEGRWLPTSADMPAVLLASRRWQWDAGRGDIVLLRP